MVVTRGWEVEELGNVGQGNKLEIKRSIKFGRTNTQHNDYRQSIAKYNNTFTKILQYA